MPLIVPLGVATLVNDLVANEQYENATATLVGGGRVVSWIDFTSGHVIFVVYDSNDNVIGSVGRVADRLAGEKRAPFILPNEDGSFDLFWTYTDGGGNTSIAQQKVTFSVDEDSGTRLINIAGDEMLLNVGGFAPLVTSSAAPLPGGGFVVGFDNAAGDIIGQLFDPFGLPTGSQFTINTTTTGLQNGTSIAIGPDGIFTALWESSNAGTNEVFLQRFNGFGGKIGPQVNVGPATADTQIGPDIVRDGTSDIVAWVRPASGGGFELVATRVTENGAFPPVVVAQLPNGTIGSPSVALIDGGGFVVSWIANNPAGADPLLGRAYDANGATPIAFGDAFTIADNARFQITSGTSTLFDGKIIFSWDGFGPGDTQGVFSRLFQVQDFGNTPTEGNDQLWDPQQPVMAPPGAVGITGTGASNIDGLGGDDTIRGYDGDDILSGGEGNDRLFGGSGSDVMNGGNGSDFGLINEATDTFIGGDGIDTAGVQGDFIGTLGIDATTEVVLVASGEDTRFGDYSGNLYDYNIILGALIMPQLTIQAAGLVAGEDLILNGSAVQGALRVFAGAGLTNVTGGAGSDGLFFGTPAAYNTANGFVAGANVDSLAFRGDYVGASALVFGDASFAGVEVIALLSGLTNEFGGFIHPAGLDYQLTMANGNVLAGQTLDINGNKLAAGESVNVDASAELDGAYRFFLGAGNDAVVGSAGADLIFGNLGADTLDGGAGNDTYVYRSAAESTAASQDAIVLATGDRIDLAKIDANTATAGIDDAFTFIGSAAFGNVAGQLRVAGGLIQADVDGDGVADLQIAFTGAAPAAPDFVL